MRLSRLMAERAARPARPPGTAAAVNRLAPTMGSMAGGQVEALTGYFVVNQSLVNGPDIVKVAPPKVW